MQISSAKQTNLGPLGATFWQRTVDRQWVHWIPVTGLATFGLAKIIEKIINRKSNIDTAWNLLADFHFFFLINRKSGRSSESQWKANNVNKLHIVYSDHSNFKQFVWPRVRVFIEGLAFPRVQTLYRKCS